MVSKVASHHLATSQKLGVMLCTGQLLWAYTKPNVNKVPCPVSTSEYSFPCGP